MGFDPHRFRELPSYLEDELTCTICCCILCKPVITPCGHSFCRDCIMTWFNQGDRSCPVCRKPVSKLVKPPVIVSNLLSRLKISCANKSRGCDAIVYLDTVDKHERECRYREKKNLFKMLVQPVVASFSSLFTLNHPRIQIEFDGEEVDEDIDFDVADDVQLVPTILQTLTALGVMYKVLDMLNRIWT